MLSSLLAHRSSGGSVRHGSSSCSRSDGAMPLTRCADEDVRHAHFYVPLDPVLAIGIDDSRSVVRDELGIDAHTPARPLQSASISAGIRLAPSGGLQIALSDGGGPMSLTTILVIAVVVILLGGGGFYWRR